MTNTPGFSSKKLAIEQPGVETFQRSFPQDPGKFCTLFNTHRACIIARCALGAYYRRMAARLGKDKAITATIHKLARLVYNLLTQGGSYIEESQSQYEARFQDRTLKYLQQKAKALGFERVPHAV